MGGFSDSVALEVAPFGIRICTLEPGGIRTNWSRRASRDTPELLPDYEPTLRPLLQMFESFRGKQEGDPRRIADLLVQLANTDDVPMRLILGVDAEKRVQQAEAARAAEAEKFRSLTHSTVYDGSVAVPEVLSQAR